VFLPLHIFEPRYRQMVADALASDRMIGMALLKPGWERDYEGRPPVYPIGCSGVMTHVEQLPDGRYHIVLRGMERFRIVEEDQSQSRSYRCAVVEPVVDGDVSASDRATIRLLRTKLEGLLAPVIDRADDLRIDPADPMQTRAVDPKIPVAMPDEDLVNALAQYLDLEPVEKQALLEQRTLRSRAESLVELLEMKVMIARSPRATNLAH
jgi:Lon protease-like protein